LPIVLIASTSSPDPYGEAQLGDAECRDHADALVFVRAPVNQLNRFC
jgi:hypothetical protein